jgi:CheY-like chemotaxis protein
VLPIIAGSRDQNIARQKIAPRVLHVEDDDRWRGIIEQILHKAGFQVDGVSSQTQAIELLRKNEYDLLLLDLNLEISEAGSRGGLKMLDYAIEHGLLRNTKVVILSGYLTLKTLRAGFGKYHVADMLNKGDFNGADFLAAVKRALAREHEWESR